MIRQLVAMLARRLPHRSGSRPTIARRKDGQFEVGYLDDLGREQERVFATRKEARGYGRLVEESFRSPAAEYDEVRIYGGGTGGGGA